MHHQKASLDSRALEAGRLGFVWRFRGHPMGTSHTMSSSSSNERRTIPVQQRKGMLVKYFAFAFTDDQLEEMRRSNDRGIYEQDFDVIANRYRDEPSGSISSPSSEAMTPSGDRPRMRSPSPPRRRRSSRDGSPRRRRSSRDESPRRRRH